jgi:hypothetical protein
MRRLQTDLRYLHCLIRRLRTALMLVGHQSAYWLIGFLGGKERMLHTPLGVLQKCLPRAENDALLMSHYSSLSISTIVYLQPILEPLLPPQPTHFLPQTRREHT